VHDRRVERVPALDGRHQAGYEIGATRAWAIDVQMRCGTTIAALKMAKDMMAADPEINTVLIAGGYRNGDLINLQNQRVSFMFNLAPVAAPCCCARAGRATTCWART